MARVKSDLSILNEFVKKLSLMYSEMFQLDVKIAIEQAPENYYREGIGYIYYFCTISIDGDQQYGTYGIHGLFINDVMTEIYSFCHAVVAEDYAMIKKFKL